MFLRLLSLVLFCTIFPTITHAIDIAKSGAPGATIVVAEGAIPSEKYAAEELANFLGQVTGGQFKIVPTAPAGTARILVGPDAAQLADPKFSIDGLGAEGIVIRTAGNDLILAGGRPRGTLYAVYSFLEDQVGCRWWTSTASFIPKKDNLSFANLNIRYVPQMEYREPYWHDAETADWAARNKANGHWMKTDEKHGGQVRLSGWCHTFERLIPPGKYFSAHPEWFSEFDGKRQSRRSQLCLTNEAMRKELIKNAEIMLKEEPSHILVIAQNDWHGHCACPKCAAVNKEEGSQSGTLVRFVNSVAEEMEKTHPGLEVLTLAYQKTRKPPVISKPRANVIIQLCSIECSMRSPLTNPRNQDFLADIDGWCKISPQLFIWDYTCNFHHHLAPHPNLRAMLANNKLFADRKATGVFSQGAFYGDSTEFAELRAWVTARQFWNPNLDPEKLIDEFLAGYYGPAAPAIKNYINFVHDAVEKTDDKVGCYAKPEDCTYMNLDNMTAALGILRAAEPTVAANPELLKRLRTVELGPLYAFLYKWDEFRKQAQAKPWPMPETRAALWDEFSKIATDAGVHSVLEGDRAGLPTLKAKLKL